jgi:hypothetical protein
MEAPAQDVVVPAVAEIPPGGVVVMVVEGTEGGSLVQCPHCQGSVLIGAINCGIFRHGHYMATGEQVDPHAPQTVCEEAVRASALVAEAVAANVPVDPAVFARAIFGCGKPFQVIFDPTTAEVKIAPCGYV